MTQRSREDSPSGSGEPKVSATGQVRFGRSGSTNKYSSFTQPRSCKIQAFPCSVGAFDMSSHTYSFFRVSKTDDVHASARKYRDLRLRALKAAPGSFASTYETEVELSDADWISLLTLPHREVFTCAVTSHESPKRSGSSEWIGQVTLRGPMSREDFSLPPESGHLASRPDSEEERWQVLGLFTLPEHRGNGLGATLCEKALEYLRHHRPVPRSIQVRLMVKPGNSITVRLYERLGFVRTGQGTLAEALIANGDEHLLPRNTSGPGYSDRNSIIMALYMDRP
ncbi:hypothetical protein N7492_010358 [Penicillium capsulatum]|uniref:N-acetyltransferase domain-containing protein n=1 Tax=Penicillium capsulatum TaxID=69766 RepID=A0A9W9LF19_9EURO|nr:hypothetical protein N7492_010358 [Penicillium capsulatum]KAJ6112862.1 hypothetical protein N7512_008186 [Penicillium capsulatum]